jgi:predicted DNA-binding protein (MmcQ/YjbR family)
VTVDGTVPDDELIELVDASYHAVVAKLPKRLRP